MSACWVRNGDDAPAAPAPTPCSAPGRSADTTTPIPRHCQVREGAEWPCLPARLALSPRWNGETGPRGMRSAPRRDHKMADPEASQRGRLDQVPRAVDHPPERPVTLGHVVQARQDVGHRRELHAQAIKQVLDLASGVHPNVRAEDVAD